MGKQKNRRRARRDAPTIDSGEFRGHLFTRIPIWYLKRLCDGGPYEAAAKAELERRGTRHPSKVKLTAHAIDRASLQAMDLYHAYRDENEGIHTWLGRVAENALQYGSWADERTVDWSNLRFCFDTARKRPVLTSVMRSRPTLGARIKKRTKGKR